MSENLFDYATKELSQDAFLRWLLENYNDPIVGPAAIKLLRKWMGLYPGQDFDVSKITKIKTYAQHKHIDLIVDVTADNNLYSFIIEDKTRSSEHDNQLTRYNKVIDSWKDSKYKYRVFYKTGYVDENELEQISKPGWKLFGVKEIRDTFEEFQNSENDVLAYYARYCDAKYQQTTSISTKQPIDWCFEEWHTWLRLELTPRIDQEFNGKVKMWYWTYQGRYASTGAYFGDLVSGKHEPVIEFFFRNGETITANVHVETLGASDDSWDRANITEPFWQAFSQHFDNGELPSFKRLNTKHCIAKMKEPIAKDNRESILENMVSMTREFYEFFHKF